MSEQAHDGDDISPIPAPTDPERIYEGIGRLSYALSALFVGFLQSLVDLSTASEPAVGNSTALLAFIVIWVLVIYRLKNIGDSGWWSLLMFIPIANILVGVRCLMMPEGYRDHRELDIAAKIVVALFLLLTSFILYGVFVSGW